MGTPTSNAWSQFNQTVILGLSLSLIIAVMAYYNAVTNQMVHQRIDQVHKIAISNYQVFY